MDSRSPAWEHLQTLLPSPMPGPQLENRLPGHQTQQLGREPTSTRIPTTLKMKFPKASDLKVDRVS